MRILKWLKSVLASFLSTPASRQREELSRLGAELDYYEQQEQHSLRQEQEVIRNIGPSGTAIALNHPLNEDYVYGCN